MHFTKIPVWVTIHILVDPAHANTRLKTSDDNRVGSISTRCRAELGKSLIGIWVSAAQFMGYARSVSDKIIRQ
jgi:hypothetical protein